MHELHISKCYQLHPCIFFPFTSSNFNLPHPESPLRFSQRFRVLFEMLKKVCIFEITFHLQRDTFLDRANKNEHILCSDTKSSGVFLKNEGLVHLNKTTSVVGMDPPLRPVTLFCKRVRCRQIT